MSSYCKYSVALPHGAVGWSAVCDCGISWPYSLVSFIFSHLLKDTAMKPTFVYVKPPNLLKLASVYKLSNTMTSLQRHSCGLSNRKQKASAKYDICKRISRDSNPFLCKRHENIS